MFFFFKSMRFDQKDVYANKPVHYRNRRHMQICHCMGRCLLCMEQMELNRISTETDVCYVLFTGEMGFLHQTFDILGWCCWCLKMSLYNCCCICYRTLQHNICYKTFPLLIETTLGKISYNTGTQSRPWRNPCTHASLFKGFRSINLEGIGVELPWKQK